MWHQIFMAIFLPTVDLFQGQALLQKALKHHRLQRVPQRQLLLCRGPRPVPPRPPSLLQKLLAKDIRRDHSHLLQCFRWGTSSPSGSIAVQHSRAISACWQPHARS